MPLYDFTCSRCGSEIVDRYLALKDFTETMTEFCDCCKKETDFILRIVPPATHDWGQGRFFEHLSAKGETFFDKRSYHNYMKENGLSEVN